MSNISVTYWDITDTTRINPTRITQAPVISLLRKYWDGSDEEYNNYLESIGIKSIEHYNSVFRLHEHANEIIDKLREAMKANNIGKFDFRVSSVITGRFFKDINEKDYAYIKFVIEDYSEEDKVAIQKAFLDAEIRSFIYYKIIDEKTLGLMYNRKGLIASDENDELRVLTARSKVTLSEAALSVKDTNFVCSGICLEIAKALKAINRGEDTISFSYENRAGEQTISLTANKIIEDSLKGANERKAIARQEELKQEAKEEVKAEMNNRRDSLKPGESTNEILKTASSQTRFDTEILNQDNLDQNDVENFDKRIIDDYKFKELEKVNIKIQKAEQDAKAAYEIISKSIKQGILLDDAISYIKQKFNNEHVANLALKLYSKDFITLEQKDNQIEKLKQEIQNLGFQIEKHTESIEKSEHKARELQSALTKKINELALVTESYEKNLQDMQIMAKQEIAKVTETLKNELNDQNALIDNQSVIIERLSTENKVLSNNNNELKEDYKNLIQQNSVISAELETNKLQAKEYKTRLAQYPELIKAKDNEIATLNNKLIMLANQNPNEAIIEENNSLKLEINKLKNDIENSKNEIKVAWKENEILKERIEELKNTYEERINRQAEMFRQYEEMFKTIERVTGNSKKENENNNSAEMSRNVTINQHTSKNTQEIDDDLFSLEAQFQNNNKLQKDK